ncbi:MAG TPA: toll/interleukin-1 receptor domain-containing protein [Ktedonobacteraceae bacterium]|nr:toll/interleukin-1 receptor domain-containing protein [Ktedonobacteraceae bacterium]
MKQQKQAGITVFFSYAQADQAVRDQLALHLAQLKRDELIKEWSDQQILAGSNRVQEIDQAIRTANIVLLFISADFLASDTCYQVEMQQVLARHRRGEVRVIPIIVRPCDWQYSPFAHLQYLPRNSKPITTWDNQDEAFLEIVQELRRSITEQPETKDVFHTYLSELSQGIELYLERTVRPDLPTQHTIKLHGKATPDAVSPPGGSAIHALQWLFLI